MVDVVQCNDANKQTEGQWRVGVSFNPGNNPDVDKIKKLSAEIIDLVQAVGKDERCTALAAVGYEEAAMWAVKSVTKKPRSS